VDIGTLFCDLTHDQTIAGDKTFSGTVNFTGTVIVPDASGGWTNDTSMNAVNKNYIKNQGYAPIDSPEFTGEPTAPTPFSTNNSTRIATTAYVKVQGYIGTDYIQTHSFFTTRTTYRITVPNNGSATLRDGNGDVHFNWGVYIATIMGINWIYDPYIPASNCNNSDKTMMQIAFVRVSYDQTGSASAIFGESKYAIEKGTENNTLLVKNTVFYSLDPQSIFVTMTQIG